MSASAVFILDVKGKPLISRNYKGDVAMSKIEHFMPLLVQREEEGALAPLLSHGQVHFLWIKHSNLYCIHPTWCPWRWVWGLSAMVAAQAKRGWAEDRSCTAHLCGLGWGQGQVEMRVVARDRVEVRGLYSIYFAINGTFSLTLLPLVVATTSKNANASLVYSFLYKTIEVFCEYFKELEEESIRDNFVIVYELLDELMDFGFPQTTDSKILQEYITQQSNKLETGKSRVPPTVTNAVSWRSEGIKYKKNEVFIDVIESVNLLVNANGSVLLSEIVGTIKLKVFLSGMPELRLGLNDRVLFELTGRSKNKSVELEDVKFHQCVRLSRFDNDRTISFIPPDGDFELMSYRLSTQVKPLIWIESVIEKFSHSRVEIMVKAKGQFKKQSVANGVEISVPVPSDADSPRFKTSVGSAKYVPEKNVVIWSIKSFPGGKEYLMRAHFGLPSVEKEEVEGRPPIGVKFEIPYFTVSGIQVRYMKIIEKSGYQALPWVRYITQSGDYQLRTS
ncbi:AP1M2 isoform 4 [Pan troglodytes]|uniref:AP-1 complex subunit mu-2 n=1 Tax=Pan troglodytes TaxID=9598 RepID=A0A2J8LWE5_PANTR|nr:AP1M2 isoform 4 [Pan troglodytes]